jgi:hypothetical protein
MIFLFPQEIDLFGGTDFDVVVGFNLECHFVGIINL